MYEIDNEKISKLKEKHGDVFLITVEDKKAVFRKPSRKELSFASAASSQGSDPMAFAESIMKNTFIEGDRELLDSDDYFLAAMPVVSKLVEVKNAEIKKL